MKITEYVASHNLELTINFSGDQVGPWIATINNRIGRLRGHPVWHKHSLDDHMLRGCAGWGTTPTHALIDLCKNLREHSYIVVGDISDTDERNTIALPRLEL